MSDPSHLDAYGNSDFIPATLSVPSQVPNAPGSSTLVDNPLKWLVGLTAGYFSQLNIVQVLNMILFPPVPYQYDPPALSISANSSSFEEVGVTFSRVYTLTFDRDDAGTASSYTFNLNTDPQFSVVTTQLTSTTASYVYYTTVPSTFTINGTMSHEEGPIFNDNYGNPSLPNISAGVITSGNLTQRTIFPYFYGRVYKETGVPDDLGSAIYPFTYSDIFSPNLSNPDGFSSSSTRVVSTLANTQNISFNTNIGTTEGNYKGWLATPQTLGTLTTPTYTEYVEPGNELNSGVIPDSGGLFSVFTLPNVDINGILHTYSVYLFNFGTSASVLTLST
jgi:hypothetical protein